MLALAVVGYLIIGFVLCSVSAGSFDSASILGTWFVDAVISGMIWFIYAKSAKPARLKSFLVFAGISIAFFGLVLLGKSGGSH
jgi:hypothetical protein